MVAIVRGGNNTGRGFACIPVGYFHITAFVDSELGNLVAEAFVRRSKIPPENIL